MTTPRFDLHRLRDVCSIESPQAIRNTIVMSHFAIYLSLLVAFPAPSDEPSASVPRTPTETLNDWSRRLSAARTAERERYDANLKWSRGMRPMPSWLEVYRARITAIDRKSKELQAIMEKFAGIETRLIATITEIANAQANEKVARTREALDAFVKEGIATEKMKQLLAQGAPPKEALGEMNMLLAKVNQEIKNEKSLLAELADMRSTQEKMKSDFESAIVCDQVFQWRLAAIDAAAFVVDWAVVASRDGGK